MSSFLTIIIEKKTLVRNKCSQVYQLSIKIMVYVISSFSDENLLTPIFPSELNQ